MKRVIIVKAKDQIKMSMQMEFNVSMEVTELLMKTLENATKNVVVKCITECSKRHGFNLEEELTLLGLEKLTLIRKPMVKKSVSEKKSKKIRVEKKSVFPFPFIGSCVDKAGCQGLAYNRGLFTQCVKKVMENGIFCKGCQDEADKNASGCPDCGTVEQRLGSGLYDFKDPKGRSPVSYLKVLNKLKLTKSQAEMQAGSLDIEIPEDHFVIVEKSKKESVARGRPKKTGVVEAENVNDLFAKLSLEGEEEAIVSDEEEEVKAPKKAKLSEEEKSAKKAKLEEERAAKKQEREAKLAQEKLEREAKRALELEQKKQEREAKLAQEKLEREAKRAQEKLEREAKRAQDQKKKPKPAAEKVVKASAPAAAPVPAPVEEEKPTAKVTVKRVQINGKAYLQSSTNILYDPNTKEEVGLWDPVTKTIGDLPEEEEEEDEYEE